MKPERAGTSFGHTLGRLTGDNSFTVPPKSVLRLTGKWHGRSQRSINWQRDWWLKAFPSQSVFGDLCSI